jgi:mannosyltransferase OCH1-like enzyme
MLIPKIIIRKASWKYNDLPQAFKTIYYETLNNNPEYTFKYFDDDNADQFIENNFPQFISYYRDLIPKAYKCDLFRLLAVYYFGGIYVDSAVQFLKPLNQIINDNDELILVKEDSSMSGNIYDINNAFIAAKQKHPLILDIILSIIQTRLQIRSKGNSPLDIAGPNLIGKIIYCFHNQSQHIRYFQFKHMGLTEVDGMITSTNFFENSYILDENNELIIKHKFPNYYKIVYNNIEYTTLFPLYHYHNLWINNNVYFPRIIHQTGPTDISKWPNIWKLCQKTWIHKFPNWEYKFWNDEDIDILVKTFFPNLYTIFKNYDVHIKRVDLAKYCILQKYGGIYVDLDYECIKKFEHFIRGDKISVAVSPYSNNDNNNDSYLNALITSPPGHPFWNTVFELIEKHKDISEVLTATGPNLLMEAIKLHKYDIFTFEQKLFAPQYNDNFRKGSIIDYDKLPLIEATEECYARHYGTCNWLK